MASYLFWIKHSLRWHGKQWLWLSQSMIFNKPSTVKNISNIANTDKVLTVTIFIITTIIIISS